ncbi:MAG: hypothetical protein O2816_11130, partial [Planctomycetota bacterium]|nr:hypothetical protein [Planctomycetota bacterium]
MPIRILFLPLLLLPAACKSARGCANYDLASANVPQLADEARPAPESDREGVIEAIERGDYRGARELLAQMIVAENQARAEAAVAAGDGEQAMILLDEALELRPRNADLLAARGRAAYAAAESVIANPSTGGNPQFFYEDALEHLLQAGSAYAAAGDREQVVRLAFDASRAARRIPDPTRALDLARAGAGRLAEFEPPLVLDPPAAQIHAEAAFDVYIGAVQAGTDSQEYYLEAEDQLMVLLGNRPTDTWPLLQLSNLYQWNGDLEGAIGAVERALALDPGAQALHDRYTQLVPGERGWPAMLEWYGNFAKQHPEDASVQRNTGVAWLFGSLAAFDGGDNDTAPFHRAEGYFETARGLDESYEQDCLGYQVIVRNAIGWCHYNAGAYAESKRAFLSMEEVFEGGLAWQLPGRLPDGITGLGFLIGKLSENPNSIGALDDLVEAAAIADVLFAYRPEDGNHANNAGFFNRDASVLFERKSMLLKARAEGAEGDERSALLAEADEHLAQAYELMQRSKQAYKIAARILNDDVRVINDAGLVIVYYTRDEAELAEQYFLEAVRLGEQQLAAGGLSDEDRYALNEAWGAA